MQVGHVPLALAIATYDWNPKTAVFVLGMHFLPMPIRWWSGPGSRSLSSIAP